MHKKDLRKLVDSLPIQVRITKDITYEVVFIDNFPDGRTLGECRYDVKQIVVNKNQPDTQILRTALHEVIHAVAMENKIRLTETHVLGLEEGLFRLLKLNGVFDLINKK